MKTKQELASEVVDAARAIRDSAMLKADDKLSLTRLKRLEDALNQYDNYERDANDNSRR